MITLNRTKLDSVSNVVLNDCLVLSSVTDSICTNTVSPVFTNCTESFTAILNQAWLTANNEINEVGQAALVGLASGGANLIDWAYSTITESIVKLLISNIPNGSHIVTLFSDSIPAIMVSSKATSFLNGEAEISTTQPIGTQVYGLVRDSTTSPSTKSAPISAITE